MTYLQHIEMTPADIRAYWEKWAPQAKRRK